MPGETWFPFEVREMPVSDALCWCWISWTSHWPRYTRAVPSKVEAIEHAPPPSNVQELRSFLGLLNYYGKFTPNLATIFHPLNALLQAEECAKAFQLAKDQLKSSHTTTLCCSSSAKYICRTEMPFNPWETEVSSRLGPVGVCNKSRHNTHSSITRFM